MPTSAHAQPSRTPRTFGRYLLGELLGRSQRTMLWLAHDPAAARDVLLTLPRSAPADAAGLSQWVSEAHYAARLIHPHLAPTLDVAVHEQWPYLVSQRSLGITLEEHLAAHPGSTHAELAGWFCQALEGLAYLHEAGIAHHDLQLHKLLIDERGQLRVLAPCAGARSVRGDAAGLQAQREAAAHDVLTLGVLFHQLLTGEAPFGETDAGRAVERLAPIGREALRLPWTTPQPLSESLRVIVNRATHHQPRQRYLNARTLLHALQAWRAADAKDTGGPLALLIDRVIAIGALPATPGLAGAVARLARMERQRTDELAEQALLDLALSFELLRQVNTLQVQSAQAAGSGPVLTVRRAIAMLGLDGVRHAANGLRPWPGPLGDGPAATALAKAIDHARLAGHLAQLLRPAGYDTEVTFLVTVLQSLGRLLLHYHFADDAEQVARLMQPGRAEDGRIIPGLTEATALQAVLGVELEAMGIAVARHWGLAEEVQHMMRRLPPERPVRAADSDADLLRAVASCALEAADAAAAPLAQGTSLDGVAKRYQRLLGVTARDLQDGLRAARLSLEQGLPPDGDREGAAAVPSRGAGRASAPSGGSAAAASGAAW